MSTDKIKERILRLRQLIPANGATEGEAMAALLKADALMQEHGLTEADLNIAQAKKDMRSGSFTYTIKTQHPCAKWCSKTIGVFCGVVTWFSSSTNSSNGFGFSGDTEMYEFLMKMVHDSMNHEWKNYVATHPAQKGVSRHTEYWSFMMGMSNRINEKLRQLIEARKVVADSTGTSLVVKKMEIVRAGMAEMMPDLTFTAPKKSSIRAYENVFQEGRKAGDKINLNRPLNAGSNNQKRIA